MALTVTLSGTVSAQNSIWEYIQIGWSSIVATVSAKETKETEKKSDDENSAVRQSTAVTTDFENFKPGTIDGQNDWKSSGSASYGTGFDVEITDNNSLIAPKSFGFHSLRLSNAFTSDSTAEQTFASLLPNEGGETSADNLGEQRGERRKLFTSEWEFASADPNAEQFGLSVVASPTRRDGSQMSYVRMVDTPEGVGVFFKEYRNGAFSEVNIASGLDRAQAHKIRLDISFEEGAGNDLVKVYVDNELKHEGTTWEDFYRNEAKTQPPTIDTISFNTNGSPYPANRGKGFLVDNIEIDSLVAPQVTSITRLTPSNQITNASTVIFRVVFSASVSGVDAGDFSFTGSIVTNPQITNINTSSPFTTYDITVSNYTGNGNLQLNVVDNNSIVSSPGGEALGGPALGDGDFNTGDTYTIDTTAPTVSSITPVGANPTTLASVTFAVTFSENVQGVDTGDFTLATTGTASGSIAGISGSGSSYTVTVSSISGDGTLGLNLVDNNSITDLVLPTPYQLGGPALGDGDFTGQTFTVDNINPTVVISPANGTFTTSPISFTAQFSESVNNFAVGDIVVGNGAVTAGSFNAVDGDTYTFTVTPTADGTVTVDIAAGAAEDAATNPNTAATQASVNFDGTVPTVTVSYSPNPTNASPINFVVTFSESVTGFGDSASDYTVTNGTVGTITGSGANYIVPVTPLADGAVTFQVNAGAAADSGPNQNTASNNLSITSDGTAPGAMVSYSPNPTNASPINFIVNFSESVTGFGDSASDYAVTNGTVGTITGSGSGPYTVPVTPGDGAVTFQVNAGAAIDAATNPNTVSNNLSIVFDGTAPTVASIVPSSGTFSSSPVNFAVTFSETVIGFDNANDVTVGGTSLPITAAITGTGTTYNVAVSGMTTDGDLTLQVNAAAAIDAASNPNAASAVNTVNFDFQPAGDFVITSANPQGWVFANENTTGGIGGFIEGPPTPPLGAGSGRLSVSAANQGQILAKLGYAGTRLDSITSLSYSTYGNSTTLSPALSLQYDQNLNDGITNFQGRLNYEPYLEVSGQPVQSGTWQTWNLLSPTARFWASGNAISGVDDVCTNASPCTLAFILANFPNIGIHANPVLGRIVFKAGSGWASFDGNVDNFTIGINSNDQNFDFEPILPLVTVEQAIGQNDPTNASPINFTAEFSENVTGFINSDVAIAGSGTAAATVIPVDGDTYTIAISGMLSGETVTVTIPQGAAQGAEGSNTVSTSSPGGNSVTYNVPTVSIAAASPGAEPGTPATFTVSLIGSNPSPVTVSYSLGGGTATGGNSSGSGNDYNNIGGTVTFIANDSTPQTITVPVFDDAVFEPTETFTATLSSPTNATLGTSSVGNTITDDGASVVSINSASADEGANIVFTVSINEPNANAVTVNYTFADVSTSATDRTAPSGTVTIPANALSAQITVPALNDNEDEPNETFTITLDSINPGSGATINPSANVGTGMIVDTDVNIVYVNNDFTDPTTGNDPDGAGPATNFGLDAFATVQGGVDGVAIGGTVIVYNGNYAEQVVIDKNLTVDGESEVGTFITLPGSPAVNPDIGDFIIVSVKNDATVDMSDVTIRGPYAPGGCGAAIFDGVFVYGAATLNLSNAAVKDIRLDPIGPPNGLEGCQTGYAVVAGALFGSLNEIGTVNLNSVDVTMHQKAGLYVDNTGSTGTVSNVSTFTGLGTRNIASYSAIFVNGGTGSVTGSSFSDNICIANTCGSDPIDDLQSAGVAVFDGATVSVTNNTITNNDVGVMTGSGANITVTGNDIVNTVHQGIQLSRGTATVSNNKIRRTDNGTTLTGISLVSPFGASGNSSATATQNTVTSVANAVQMLQDTTPFAPLSEKTGDENLTKLPNRINTKERNEAANGSGGGVPSLTANYNRFISSTTAIDNPQSHPHSLEFNWWGCNAGPGNLPANTGCGAVVGTGADFDPWVVLTASATPLTVNPGGTSTVSADLRRISSAGNPLLTGGTIPDTPVLFTATEGTMSACTATPEVSATNCLLSNNLIDTSTFTSNSNDDATATVTVDNQAIPIAIAVTEPMFSIDDVTVDEDDGTATFTVTLTGTSVETATVNVGTTDGTANLGSDFGAVMPTSLSFGPQTSTQTQEVTVPITEDGVFEGTTAETFFVNLSGATNATISDATGDGAIVDNEGCNYVITPTTANFPIAGGNGSFSVTVTNGCTWTAASNAGWITVTGGTPGNGNGTVTYTVANNPGGPRSGAINITGINNLGTASHTVNQSAGLINVVIPTGLTARNNGTLSVPVNVTTSTTGSGIVSFEFDLTFDSSILTFTGADVTGTIASGYTVFTNVSDNTLSISGTGSDLSGSGPLVFLNFTVNELAPNCSDFDFVPNTFLFNAGIPAVATTDGQACIQPGSISGIVEYANTRDTANPPQPTTPLRRVPNVLLTATGTTGPTVTDTTDSPNGEYELLITADGNYTVVPSRTRAARLSPAITADDATLIQRARVGQIPALTGVQKRAADVNKDGIANSFDASLIQQFKTGTVNPGNFTGIWEFELPSNTYTEPNETSQTTNYTAILLGDPTGNWMASQTQQLSGENSDEKLIDSNPFFNVGGVMVTLPTTNEAVATNFNIPVSVSNLTGEGVSSYDFDVTYNPAVITPQGTFFSTAGTLSGGGICNVLAGIIEPGRLAVSASCPSGISGAGTLINLTFSVVGSAGMVSDLAFSPFIFNSGIPTNTSNVGRITIVSPTSANASVSGKLADANGNGIGKTIVTVTAGNGATRSVVTNSFGNYAFADLPVGQTYVISVSSKKYRFTPESRVVTVNGDATDVDFTADGN